MSQVIPAIDYPDVRRKQVERRLALSLFLSTMILGALIVSLRFPLSLKFDFAPNKPIEVSVIAEELVPQELPELEFDDVEPVEEPAAEESVAAVEDATERTESTAPEETETHEESVDWHALLESAAENSDQIVGNNASMHSELDELRRVAKLQYSKPVTREKKPIWENVETDQRGRKLLVHGDCYRVLSDPSVMNRWVQENFGQYMVFCNNTGHPPMNLAFVDEVVDRRTYLQDDQDLLASQFSAN
jgi:hypothetical protein